MQNQHRQHADMGDYPSHRTERVLAIALAFFIGTGLAAAMVQWWAT